MLVFALVFALLAAAACTASRRRAPQRAPGDFGTISRSAATGPSNPSCPTSRSAALPAPAAGPGFSESAIDAAVETAVAQRLVPGAVVVVGRHDRVLFRKAYGLREVQPDRVAMTLDTLFDLASLTKPIATATSILLLAERGAIGLDDPLVKYVSECAKNGKSAITLRHLLLHVSGLPADTPKSSFAQGRDQALARICSLPLRAAPGLASTYSDIGFVLLEEIVRRVTSRELPAFAEQAIFAPLGMTDTGFRPSDDRKRRAAWTEQVDGVWRVGVVHDPRAFLLGGVAGHAGLFSTGDDLAIYARAILGRGAVDGKRVMTPHTAALMIAPHDVPGAVRALGWAMSSSWRGEGLSPSAVGHFGFTGTAMWIDTEKDLFTVVLTNRVHPNGVGDAKPLVAHINTLVAAGLGPTVGPAVPRFADCDGGTASLRTGIDVLRGEDFQRLRGRHIGLITNASGKARDGASTIDLFGSASGLTLEALFVPEHGLTADGQGRIANARDPRSGLPIYSLYGETLAPSRENLAGIDTLVFDVQDAGTRFFTYASTMKRAMKVAADADVRFVVLDRPNPIGGVDADGPVQIASSPSFVNYHALPVRHGMTVGELALLFNADDHLGVSLSVVPMRGWNRSLYGDETGLPWVNPSPNLRSVVEALLYPAVGLLEATNLSVGRGTDAPFERVGAPWIDGNALAAALAVENLPGVEVAAETFEPDADRYAGRLCGGIHLSVHDRLRFACVRTGLAIARALRRLYPREWEFAKLDRLLANPDAMRAIDANLPLDAIVDTYREELAAFVAKRDKYLLYDACAAPVP